MCEQKLKEDILSLYRSSVNSFREAAEQAKKLGDISNKASHILLVEQFQGAKETLESACELAVVAGALTPEQTAHTLAAANNVSAQLEANLQIFKP